MCNTNINNYETSQDIIYTAACNSNTCKNNECCCYEDICENNAMSMVLALSERMEECCAAMHGIINDMNCRIDNIVGSQSVLGDIVIDGEKLIISLQH